MDAITDYDYPVFSSGALGSITRHSCYSLVNFIWFTRCVEYSYFMYAKGKPLLHVALEHILQDLLPSWNAGPLVHSLNVLASASKILGGIVGKSGGVGANALKSSALHSLGQGLSCGLLSWKRPENRSKVLALSQTEVNACTSTLSLSFTGSSLHSHS